MNVLKKSIRQNDEQFDPDYIRMQFQLAVIFPGYHASDYFMKLHCGIIPVFSRHGGRQPAAKIIVNHHLHCKADKGRGG